MCLLLSCGNKYKTVINTTNYFLSIFLIKRLCDARLLAFSFASCICIIHSYFSPPVVLTVNRFDHFSAC